MPNVVVVSSIDGVFMYQIMPRVGDMSATIDVCLFICSPRSRYRINIKNIIRLKKKF